mmetsp:Transcript_52159/g.124285  ORF Transcript_52159/g.124285 Transcript_52159/m.124285 type:complete len:483 (-) Transcript_52159:125-1573(-)
MSKQMPDVQSVVAAASAIVLAARARDVRHMPRLLVEKDNDLRPILKTWASSLVIFGYEKVVAAILRRLGLTKMPSTLGAMLSLFAILRATQKLKSRQFADKIADVLKPGVDFLGKWMGLFLAPPLASLDKSIAALPPYKQDVWAKTVGFMGVGWSATHTVAASVATGMQAAGGEKGQQMQKAAAPPTQAAPAAKAAGAAVVSQDEAVRRAWVLLGALGFLGAAAGDRMPMPLRRPVGMLAELSTTIIAFTHAKLLPEAVQRILHPLVVCAAAANLSGRFVGPIAPYFDAGRGVGDRLFQWLNAAVTGLGVRMYYTTPLWLDSAKDFKTVLTTCGVSGVFSLVFTALVAVARASPIGVPAPLSLPLCHRSVMSALGIEGSQAIGPECDPKLAVASILITGCIGASLGKGMLQAIGLDANSPLVLGTSMGCSAHSIGTAGLISTGDTDAAAISGASMCLAGTVHTAALAIPGMVPWIRALAGLQ